MPLRVLQTDVYALPAVERAALPTQHLMKRVFRRHHRQPQPPVVYLYSEEWRLLGHTTRGEEEFEVGRRFVHEGREYEIFEGGRSASAAPPGLLPLRVTQPWSHTMVADSLAETFDPQARLGKYWNGHGARAHEVPWQAYEWRNRLDDQLLSDYEETWVGRVLYTQAEADAMQQFFALVDPVIDELGEAPFEAYEAHPAWRSVVAAAHEALNVLRENAPF